VAATASAMATRRPPLATPASAPLRQAKEEAQLSAPGRHMWVKRSAGTGCRNWKDIMVGSVSTEPSVYVCSLRCRNSHGCSGFGYQENSCNDSSKGRDLPGACTLWSGDCHMEDNQCQDDYQMEEEEAPDWLLRSWGTACSNFYDIRLGPYSIETSVSACGAKCMKNEECVGFGYQSGSCDDWKSGALPGACYLWKGACQSSPNACFDDYSMAKAHISNFSVEGATARMSSVSNSSDDMDTEVHVRKILTTVNSTGMSTTATSTTTSVSKPPLAATGVATAGGGVFSNTSSDVAPITKLMPSERAASVATDSKTRRTSNGVALPSFTLHHLSLDKLKKNKTLEEQVLKVLRESVAVGLGHNVEAADVDLQLSV